MDERVKEGEEEQNVVILTVVRLADGVGFVARHLAFDDFVRRNETWVELKVFETIVVILLTYAPGTDVNFKEELVDCFDSREIPIRSATLVSPELCDSILNYATLDCVDSAILVDAATLLPSAIDEDSSLEWEVV